MNTYSVLSQAQLLRVSDGQTSSLFETRQRSKRTLVLIWPQLGDFDTLEYAWWVQRERAKLESLEIEVRAVGIGDRSAGQKFCAYTGFPPEHLHVDPTAALHDQLNLYKGLTWNLPGLRSRQNGYFNLLLMCAGIGSPGTLKEVLRGYTGDKSAPQLIADDEVVKAAPLPALRGETFKAAGGKGFQRPFELATLRLRNMTEVLSNWKTYVPDATYLTYRGATFLFEADGKLVYEWRDHNILGFAENMSSPLSFLDKLPDL
ncbi:MAG: peroxiredoxin-like family protein [Phormidesmis sp.]